MRLAKAAWELYAGYVEGLYQQLESLESDSSTGNWELCKTNEKFSDKARLAAILAKPLWKTTARLRNCKLRMTHVGRPAALKTALRSSPRKVLLRLPLFERFLH
jgi:hypothetical protein